MQVYIVQGDSRDHHGEILLVTSDKQRALAFCVRKLRHWNRDVPELWAHSKKLPQEEFLALYLGNAWVSTPQLSTYRIRRAK